MHICNGGICTPACMQVPLQFPLLEKIVPALTSYTGQQITIRGRGLCEFETRVEVGGVVVSGPPIMRTVLLNRSSNMLWEISVEGEEDFSDWEIRTAASYRTDADTSSWDAHRQIYSKKRRSQSQQKRSSQKNGSSLVVDQDLSTHWYPFWKDYSDEQNRLQPPVFSASTTHENMTLWDGTPAYTGLHQPEAQINISMSNKLRKVRLVTPGPVVFRRLLGSAHRFSLRYIESLSNNTISREATQRSRFSRQHRCDQVAGEHLDEGMRTAIATFIEDCWDAYCEVHNAHPGTQCFIKWWIKLSIEYPLGSRL